MQPNKSLPWWKRILVDEQFRKQLTFIATEIYRQEQITLEKYPERITRKESTSKERKACEPSCISSSSNQKEIYEEEEEFFTKCTSQFLFLDSDDNVATHHPQSIINTSSYKVQHSMLLPTITPEQNKFTKNNNPYYNSDMCNAEEEVGNGKYATESHCKNNNNMNASSVVSNYLHRVRRYSTETSERCKKCDARDIIHNNLEYQEARDALNAHKNYKEDNVKDNTNILKTSKSVFYFPSIESVEESMMWARATQNTPYAKLFAVKSARTQVDERKKEYMASQVKLHKNITNSCNRQEKTHNSKYVNNKNDEVGCEYDEMHFRKLLARSCVDGANNLYGLSYYWSTSSSSSSHSNQFNELSNITTINNGGNRCNLPPAGFIRVNPDPRYAMWPDIDNNDTSSMNEKHNVELEQMCSSDKSLHLSHYPQHKRRWERLKEYVNKRNAKLAMLRAHGCEITMNMLHDNTYTLEDKALQQWMSETKQNRQEMEKSNWYSSHEQQKTIDNTNKSDSIDNESMLNYKKACIKPFRHNPLFVNFMKPIEHHSKNSNYSKTKRTRSNKWQCVGTFRQSQLLILYKIYCVALHKYSTIQQKKKELRSHLQLEEEEEEELDLSDVPLLKETESVYKISWSSTNSNSQKEPLMSQEEPEHKKHDLLGLLSCGPTHLQQYNSSIGAECEMKWQWWWDYLHNSSLLARQALRDIYNCLPLNSERELGADGYMAFVQSLLNLFFPTYVGNNDLYDKIAHEEWVYRGTAEILIPFNTFYEKFFSFPFIFMRDIAASTEQDYVEFWTLVRICLYGDHSQNHCTYFFTHLPYVNSTHKINTKKEESSLQLQNRKDKSKITNKTEMDGLDWSARFTNSNSNDQMMSLSEKEKTNHNNNNNNTSMWKLTRPSLLGANFSKRRLSLLVPLQHFTLDQLRYLNTYPYEHLAPRHKTNQAKNENNKWQIQKNVNKELCVEEEEEVINDITTLHSCKTHLYDDPLAASFIRSKLFTLQEKDRFNRTLSSTIVNSERFITEHKSDNYNSSSINNELNTDTSVKMICDVNHADVGNQVEHEKENNKILEEKVQENVKEQKVEECKEKERSYEEEQSETISTHLPLIEHVPQASTSSLVHPLLRQHRSIRIASAGNSRRRMLREAETRIKLKNLLNHSYMYARRRVNLAGKLHNKLSSLEATSSSWNLYKDDVYALPLHSPSNTKEEEQAIVKEDNKENRENIWEHYNTINYDNDDDNIDELLNYVADVDDEVFDNAQVSLRDRFRIHKKYTKLTM